MISLGWGDPIESAVKLSYRRKGEKREHEFAGPVGVLGEDRKSITWMRRSDLPLRDGRMDLSMVPVVGIGGKRKHQPWRAQQFLEENPSFQGALLLYPGTGNWDLGEGMIFVTSREILSGRRVSGGRPEVQFTNHRWLRDGRYVADRAKMLHGKVLETIEAAIEQEPGPEKIVEAFRHFSKPFECILHGLYETSSREAYELERRRVSLSGEQSRDMFKIATEALARKLERAGVRFVRDVPTNFSFTASDIDPELVAQAETLGTIEIPGVGRKPVERQYAQFGFGDQVPAVALTIEEFCSLESWPFDKVYPLLNELGNAREQLDYGIRDAMEAPEAERLGKLRDYFAEKWLDHQRLSNRPKDEKVADPREADPPATPDPVMWGKDLLTGKEHTAYAALIHRVEGCKGSIYDRGWEIHWYEEAEAAAKRDGEGRREAMSHVEARRLEAELEAEAKEIELPVALPAPFVPFAPQLDDLMRRLGFTPEQFRIEGEGPVQVCVKQAEYYWSKIREESRLLSSAVYASRWWQRDGETIVVFANATPRELLGDQDYLGVAGQLEVAKDKIQAVRDWLAGEQKRVEDSYRTMVRQFVQDLRSLPVFASLSSDMQAKLAGLEDSYMVPNLSSLEMELRSEWAKATVLLAREQKGEGLANFGGHFRVMGATGNVDFWVVRPDGSLRDPDEVQYRKRYTSEGEKYWRLVGPEELAISWFKAYTAADHDFVVNKLPIGGCTPEQLMTVKRIEREIAVRFDGSVGMSGSTSPVIGRGWNLGGEPIRVINPGTSASIQDPEPVVVSTTPADLSKVDLGSLFGGRAKTNKGRR